MAALTLLPSEPRSGEAPPVPLPCAPRRISPGTPSPVKRRSPARTHVAAEPSGAG